MQVDPRKVNLAEADIEQYLFENPKVVRIHSDFVDRWLKRQYHVPSGIIDLLGVTERGSTVVVEIKNTELKQDAILQVKRYAYDIDSMMCIGGAYARNCIPVLIGSSVSGSVFRDCEACGVYVNTFAVSFSLNIQENFWDQPYLEKREGRLVELGQEGDIASHIAKMAAIDKSHDEQLERLYAEAHARKTSKELADEPSHLDDSFFDALLGKNDEPTERA